MKTVTIDLKRNVMIHDDVFELENLATILTIDFSGMGVDGWEKFLDYRNAKGEKGQIELGKDSVVSYNVPNTLMEQGILALNPIAKRLEKDGETVRQQAFKTFNLDIQNTVNTYGEGSSNKDDIILPMRKDIKDLQLWKVTADKHQQIQDNRLDSIEANDKVVSKWIKDHDELHVSLNSRLSNAEGKLVQHSRILEEHQEDIDYLKKHGGGGEGGNMTPEQVEQLDKATTDNARQDDEISKLNDDLISLIETGSLTDASYWTANEAGTVDENISLTWDDNYSVISKVKPEKTYMSGKLEKANYPIEGIKYTGEEDVIVSVSMNFAYQDKVSGALDISASINVNEVRIGNHYENQTGTILPVTVTSTSIIKSGDVINFMMRGAPRVLTKLFDLHCSVVVIPVRVLNGNDIPESIKKRLNKLEESQKGIVHDLSRLFGDNKIPLEAQSMSRDTWTYDAGIKEVVLDQRVPAFDDYPMTYVKGESDGFKLIAGYSFKRGVLEKDVPYQCTIFVSNKSDSRLAISLSGVDIKGYEYVEPHTTRTVIINSKGLGLLITQLSFHAEGEVEFYAGGISVRKNRLLAEMTQETREVQELAKANEQKIGATNGIAMTNRTNIGKLDGRTTVLEQGIAGTNNRVGVVENRISTAEVNIAGIKGRLEPTAITWRSDSNDWFNKPTGLYYTRDNGVALGYPADWTFIDHRVQGGDFVNQISDKGFRQFNKSQSKAWLITTIEAISTKNVTVAPGYTLDYYYAKRTGNIISFQFLVRGTFTFNVWKEVIRGIPRGFKPLGYSVYAGGGGEGGVAAVAEITKEGTINVNHRFTSDTRSWFAFSGSYCV